MHFLSKKKISIRRSQLGLERHKFLFTIRGISNRFYTAIFVYISSFLISAASSFRLAKLADDSIYRKRNKTRSQTTRPASPNDVKSSSLPNLPAHEGS